jgi:hypothetical protein
MASLRLVSASGQAIDVSKDTTVVGREADCDVVLSDGSVSRRHARIERRGDSFFVLDQGSANGTHVDGERVGEAELRDGQELRFGAVRFRVELLEVVELDATVARPGAPLNVKPPPDLEETHPSFPAPPLPPLPTGLPQQPSSPPPPPPSPEPFDRTESPVPPMPAPPLPKKGRGPFFWMLAGCFGCLGTAVLLVALLAGGVYYMTSGPAAVVRGQLEEIRLGQRDRAYERLSESYRARLSRAEFDALVEAHPAMRNNADSSFWQRSLDTSTARLTGMLTSASGGREPVSYELVKEQGGWRIAAIHFGH